ncbi:hypothetical protein TWF694_009883 [Orbilia ellipsospora]|uniref:Uncharacterized protein n=1 Tax=Orbilia ellipsospora TaxID=2528407 RepID=A0AAV9XC65_9PEZI
MVLLAIIFLIGLKTRVVSTPVPPKTYQGFGGTHGSGPKVVFSQPVVLPEDPATELTVYNSADTTASLPSVTDEKVGHGWIQNVAGPPLYTIHGISQPQFYNSKQTGTQYKGSGMGHRLNTAHEFPSEYEESQSQDNRNSGDMDDFDWRGPEEGGQLTARLHAIHAEKNNTPFVETYFGDDEEIEYGDQSNESRYLRQNAQIIYGNDPNMNPNFGDYSTESPFRKSLRHLLRKPLYKPIEELRAGSRIKKTDSYNEAVEKMWDNVQGIPERSSLMEQTTLVQSTVRLGDGPALSPQSRVKNARQILELAGQSPSASLQFDQGRNNRDRFLSISNDPGTVCTGTQYEAPNNNQVEPEAIVNPNINTLTFLPLESPNAYRKQNPTKIPSIW